MRLAKLTYLVLALASAVATPAEAQIARRCSQIITQSTTPLPVNSCVYIDQNGTDTAATNQATTTFPNGIGYAAALGARGNITQSKTANYTVVGTDNGATFDNTGATGEVDFTLPAEANNMNFTFCVVAAFTVKVIAPTGVKIAIGASNSAAAGNVSNATPFGCVTLYSPNGATTQWVARNSTGTWTVTELARKRYIA